MSWYQMHRCVYDWVRAGEVNSADGGDGRAGFDVASYELSDEERKAFDNQDIAAFYNLGLHEVLLNRYARAAGRPDDYRKPRAVRTAGREESSVAEIVLAYCASHAPMMSSARMAAPEEQRNNFFGALDHIREEAVERGSRRVVLSNEHYTNFFLENFRSCASATRTGAPPRSGCRSTRCGSRARRLANHIARHTLDAGFDPAFSHQLELDHGIMTVYYELDHGMKIPLVRSCRTVRRRWCRSGGPTSSARRWATPSGPTRACSGWPSSAPAASRTGSATAGRRHRRGLRPLVPRAPRAGRARPGARHPGRRTRTRRQRARDPQLAGRGRCRRPRPAPHAGLRTGVPWITGMAVAEWETMPDRDQTSATVGAQDTRREESLT